MEAGNYQENIHLASYEEQYRAKRFENTVIADYGRKTESLNGLWHYAVDQYDTCLRAKWFEEEYLNSAGLPYPVDFSFDNWDRIAVPACWNTQSEKLFLYEGPIVYTRKFNYQNHGEDRVFIKIGAANYQAAVFINKQYMGMHLGGSTPFYIEVTDVLQKQNRILIVCNNTRRRTNVPCENTDWFNYGGIYRDVEVLRLPKAFIRDFRIWLEPNTDFGRIGMSVSTDGAKNGTVTVSIPELGVKESIAITEGQGALSLAVKPELWDVNSPKLYNVEVTFENDVLRERIGFREIKTEGDGIYLNGRRIFLKGICAHEESVLNGKAVTEAEIRENFRLAKEMNCNYMRLAHYPHTEKAARIADETGLLLWEEIPVYWAIEFGNPGTYRDAENQLAELITRDMNRASVIIWSVGNENADTDERFEFMSRLARKTKQLDPSRLVSAACLVNHVELKIDDRLCDEVDVIGINEYFGWYVPDFSKFRRMLDNSNPGKPVIISEFGADASAGNRGTRDDMFTEDHQLEVFRKQIEVFRTAPSYLCGTSPWILFDFRCPRRTNLFQNYYNLKGMLSADKQYKKLAFHAMREFYGGTETNPC